LTTARTGKSGTSNGSKSNDRREERREEGGGAHRGKIVFSHGS